MKIYRFVCEKELEEITVQNKIRLWDPKKWGKNEGVLSRILEKKDEISNKKIIELINIVARNEDLNLNSQREEIINDFKDSLEKVYCDLYTEILNYYRIYLSSFCQCWTKNINTLNINLDGYENYAALIEAESFNQCKIELDNNGIRKEWILRFSDVNYREYSYSDNIQEIINEFNKNGRKFTYFIKTLQNKHIDQNEIRLTATLNDNNFYGDLLTFGYLKYGNTLNINNLADSLHDMSLNLLDNYNKFCLNDNGNRFIYCDIPQGFITNIKEL